MAQYLVKKKSISRENKRFKWLPHYNHDFIGLIALATSCGAFETPKTENDMFAIQAIIDVCLEDGEFWEFGEYLVWKKV